MGPNQIWLLSLEEDDVKMQTHKEDSHVQTEAEIRAMLPQVKEHLGLPEPGRGKEAFFTRGFRGSMVLPTCWFPTPSLQNHEKVDFSCFKPHIVWYFVLLLAAVVSPTAWPDDLHVVGAWYKQVGMHLPFSHFY